MLKGLPPAFLALIEKGTQAPASVTEADVREALTSIGAIGTPGLDDVYGARAPLLEVAPPVTAPRRMAPPAAPLVADVANRFGSPAQFKGVRCVALQHLLGSTRSLFGEAVKLGLEPGKTTLIGKHYSTHKDTLRALNQDGFSTFSAPIAAGLPGAPSWSPWASGRELDFDYVRHATSFGIARSQETRVLLVDDGAEGMYTFGASARSKGVSVGGVEQTRFGARKLHARPPDFPVVNVAESPVKLLMESVLIGESVAVETAKTIDSLRRQLVPVGDEVALFGFGAVGRASAVSLREQGYQVTIVEPNEERRNAALAEGFRVATKEQALPLADIVLGTTGMTVLAGADYGALKDGAVLVSASSSSVEFGDAPDVRMQTPNNEPLSEKSFPAYAPLGWTRPPPAKGTVTGEFRGQAIALGIDSAHKHRVLEQAGRQFLLVNSGCPINLTGQEDPIRPGLIQLTRALLLLGMIQAERASRDPEQKGLVPLDIEGQRFIADQFIAYVRSDAQVSPRLREQLEAAYLQTCAALHHAEATATRSREREAVVIHGL